MLSGVVVYRFQSSCVLVLVLAASVVGADLRLNYSSPVAVVRVITPTRSVSAYAFTASAFPTGTEYHSSLKTCKADSTLFTITHVPPVHSR